jgi:hypothetical protein
MASPSGGNVDKLQQAGLIKPGDLPDSYQEVFEDLSEDEVNTLVTLKSRVDEAEATHKQKDEGHSAADCLIPL